MILCSTCTFKSTETKDNRCPKCGSLLVIDLDADETIDFLEHEIEKKNFYQKKNQGKEL